MNNTTALKSTTPNSMSDIDQFFANFVDFSITFIIQFICFYGIISNILNIIIFSNREFKDLVYKYLNLNACSNIIYLSVCFFLFVGRCGIYCSFGSTLAANIYMNYFYNYLKGIPAMTTVLLQIVVALYKYFVITNRKSSQFESFRL